MRSELSARLDAYFKLTEHGTSVRTEILAGITTFLTMAYIAFANPAMLADAGMDFGAVFVATCLAAAIGTAIMGLHANYPVALAPGMGLNAFFAYSVVLGMGHTWQVALGVVFVSGVLFVILSLLPVREWIIDSIPKTLKLAISAGIGLFLGIIALRNAGIVVGDPVTLVGLGNLHSAAPLLAVGGFVLIIALDHRGVPGAIILGILATAALGVGLGVSEWRGIASLPPDPSPTLLQLDVRGAVELSLIPVVFSFLFVDLFDTSV
jgi:AGZA family xanthine/uracil permease-like MFS transporter